jgi:hypothetical protein
MYVCMCMYVLCLLCPAGWIASDIVARQKADGMKRIQGLKGGTVLSGLHLSQKITNLSLTGE